MSLGLLGIQAKGVTSLSSLQRLYSCSDLALLRSKSKMAKVWAGDPTAALLSGNNISKRWRTQLHHASGAKHIKKSTFPKQHSTVLATET